MNIKDAEKINQLAMTLKNNGLAASMAEAVEKAKEIILGSQVTKKTPEDLEKEIKEVEDDIEKIGEELPDEEDPIEVTEDLNEVPPPEVQQDLTAVNDPRKETEDMWVEIETSEPKSLPDVPSPVPAEESEPITVDTDLPAEEPARQTGDDLELTAGDVPLKDLLRDDDVQSTIDEASDTTEEPSPVVIEPQFGDPEPAQEQVQKPGEEPPPEEYEEDILPPEESLDEPEPPQEEVGEEEVEADKPSAEEQASEPDDQGEAPPTKEEMEEEKEELSKYFNFGKG